MDESGEDSPAPVERTSPGVAALFEGLEEDGSHAILDLGSATAPTFGLYHRFAQVIRFADVLVEPSYSVAISSTLQGLGPPGQRPYDLVLAWNILDRLGPEDRPVLVDHLCQLTTADARVYVLVDASGRPEAPPLRFSLLDQERVREEVIGPPQPTRAQLLPAEVQRLLRPFQVAHAFTLRRGFREYMAVRKDRRQADWLLP